MDTKLLWIITLAVAVLYVTLRRITRGKAQASGARAAQAAAILARSGFKDVVNAGGIANMLATGSCS